MPNTTNPSVPTTDALLDSHIDYLISLIPDDNVVYGFSHEIHHTQNAPSLCVRISTHFPHDNDVPYHSRTIDPTNTTGSIHELLKIRKEYGTPDYPAQDQH